MLPLWDKKGTGEADGRIRYQSTVLNELKTSTKKKLLLYDQKLKPNCCAVHYIEQNGLGL